MEKLCRNAAKKRKLNVITEGYLKLLVWRKGEDGGIKWGFWLGNLAYLLVYTLYCPIIPNLMYSSTVCRGKLAQQAVKCSCRWLSGAELCMEPLMSPCALLSSKQRQHKAGVLVVWGAHSPAWRQEGGEGHREGGQGKSLGCSHHLRHSLSSPGHFRPGGDLAPNALLCVMWEGRFTSLY